jgi:transposase
MEGLMARAYSMDLRERILQDCDGGMSSEDAARKYSVSITWVYSLRKQRRETGSIAPKTYKPGPKMKLAPYEKEVRQAVAEHPDATLLELAEMLSPHVSVSTTTVGDFLKHLKITWKKNAPRRRTTPRRCCRTARRMERNPRGHRR